jgi:hypothetical protein
VINTCRFPSPTWSSSTHGPFALFATRQQTIAEKDRVKESRLRQLPPKMLERQDRHIVQRRRTPNVLKETVQ